MSRRLVEFAFDAGDAARLDEEDMLGELGEAGAVAIPLVHAARERLREMWLRDALGAAGDREQRILDLARRRLGAGRVHG